jgi:uncharacterized protein
MTTTVLVLVLLAAIVIIPLGLPGTWVLVGVAVLYDWVTGTDRIGVDTMVTMVVLAALAEVLDVMLTGRYTRRYGGSRRAAWSAVLGGLVGAFAGVPVPFIGSVIGAFAGAFLGALIAESWRGRGPRAAVRVATGAMLGRAAAAAIKVGVGCVMAAWLLVVVLR